MRDDKEKPKNYLDIVQVLMSLSHSMGFFPPYRVLSCLWNYFQATYSDLEVINKEK